MAYIDKEKFLKKIAECFGHFGVLVKAIEEIAEECTEYIPCDKEKGGEG